MEKETFRKLKEINSLYLENQKTLQSANTEGGRLTKILKMEDLRKDELENHLLEKSAAISEMAEIENKIAQLQLKKNQTLCNKNNVFSQEEIDAFEKQLSVTETDLDELEEKGLYLLEQIEEYTTQIEEAQNFLSGVQETKKEISDEILKSNQPLLDKIQVNEKRMEHLFSELPDKVTESFKSLVQKNLKYGATAQIDKNHCSICKMILPQIDIEKVEKHLHYMSCPSCSRVFIPVSSLY